MDRETAWIEFHSAAAPLRKQFRQQAAAHLAKNKETLELAVQEAAGKIKEQMEELGKEYISFLYGSVLKSDLIKGQYRFYFHAMTLQWYLDEEPAEAYVDAAELLHPLAEFREKLEMESRRFNGYINQYDVWTVVFEELASLDSAISVILRYQLMDWEKKGIFSGLSLAPYWIFKWGEYRGQTQFILAVDRVPKEDDAWENEMKKAEKDKEALVFGYWYQGECKDSRLSGKDMRFSVFEQCCILGFAFAGCNMEGCRFPGSRIADTSFEECCLKGADFTGSKLERVSFAGAELTGTRFLAGQVPFLDLSPDQLQEIEMVREEQA